MREQEISAMHPASVPVRTGHRLAILAVLGVFAFLGFSEKPSHAADQKPAASLQAAPIPADQWLKAPTTPLKPGEIDRLILQELQKAKIKPAPLITDEQFVRRVFLDLTGELPMPADVTEFLADKAKDKRAKLINKLLDSDEYARHWAGYWREVIAARLEDVRGRIFVRQFENWMAEELKKNTGWGKIARAMITATGDIRFAEQSKNGAAYFLASRIGADANIERAAETSRIFLGIQIQCAQCHDHPSDVWKRQQFHDLVGYYARLFSRPFQENGRLAGLRLVSRPRGEYFMPSKDDPTDKNLTHPRFLTGEAPAKFLDDLDRRKALADVIITKKTYWFAAAFVNRVWGELMGQAFYQPVDDLGPEKDAVLPTVFTRLAGSFQGSDYNIKALFRAVLNSQAYQRQVRPGESLDEHLYFAASYPTRLRADVLWQSLVNVLGRMGPPRPLRPRGPFAIFQGIEGLFKTEFKADPSTKPDEVEGSVSQALLMMNNPVINQRIAAQGTNLLARVLKAYPRDDDAIRLLYLRTLSRKPTRRELDKVRNYIKKVGKRAEAFEDILWALINSTEFQTRR
jgi:hypothetical protein